MFNLKKQVSNHRIKQIIKKYPYVLFIQFNNVTPKKWHSIKHQLSGLGIIKTLKVKNKIALKLLENTVTVSEKKKTLIYAEHTLLTKTKNKDLVINNIFQGQTLMLGCSMVEQLPAINTILQQNNNLLFIGGFFENQVITHLDFQKIIKLDKSIFINLIQECSNPINSIFSIKSLIDLESFACIQKCLLKVLNTHKNILKLS